jgi:hypothetical protein
MNELADRIEALKYPCHEIDSVIAEEIGMPFRSRRDSKGRSKGREWLEDSHGGVETWVNNAPRYTSSIDAAMTLMPKGWSWSVGFDEHGNRAIVGAFGNMETIASKAANPALAICAAALRARA